MSPEQLRAQGLEPQGEPSDQGLGEVGCDFNGDDLTISILKSEEDDIASWKERRDNFDEFEPNKVGDRQGIRGIAMGGVGQGVCNQIIEAGNGTVDIVIAYSSDQIEGNDPCAKAMEIAELIEPKLPA